MSDVLTRLDSLVANTAPGILKSKGKGKTGTKRITFPEAIHEVIGYGGVYAEEDEEFEENGNEAVKRGPLDAASDDDEEDREFSNLTRKNTNFNSHLQNLNGESKPLGLLGSTKTKNPPLITVRPFSHRETGSSLTTTTTTTTTLTINKVSPMMKGQLVKKSLGSDGDEEESSDSGDSIEPEEEEVLKPKVVSSARLSFLNGTISLGEESSPTRENEPKGKEPSSSPVPQRYISTSVIKNVHIKTSISRKPPILKEKPTVKITSRALLERRKSSEDEYDEEEFEDDVMSSASSDVCSYDVTKKEEDNDETLEEQEEEEDKEDPEEAPETPVAAPRKLSIHSMIPFTSSSVSISSESSKILVSESSENKVQSSIKLLSVASSENIPSKAPPPIKLPLEAKSSFELNRASIANALEFNRIDKSIRTSTKRKAPLAPSLEEIPIHSSADQERSSPEPDSQKPLKSGSSGVVPKPPPLPPVNLFKNISLAITSNDGGCPSMQSAISKRVSIIKESSLSHDYIESSFTAGKPIKTVPPPEPVAFLVKDEDEVRKWKEKKQPYPVSPDISGEILGSSKKCQQNFLTAAANMVINKAEQQIGAAIDESVKLKKLSEKKFSFKKFFHGSSNSLKRLNGDSDSSSSSSTSSSGGSSAEKSCLDKEHEREILERERKSMGKGGILRKARPEIIHPCTFSIDDDAAAPATKIEVVKIIPGEATSRSVGKQTISRSLSSDPQLCLKDQPLSVHKNTETDSISSSSTIDTEYSNKSETTISSAASMSYGSETESSSSSSCGKAKPAPPPRRHSLENFSEPGPLRNNRDQGLDRVNEEQGTNEALQKSNDEDFRNSLLIIPEDEGLPRAFYPLDKSIKAMIQMNNEALRILFEKFNSKPSDSALASKLNECDLCLSDFDVSKSSRLSTRIGSFYEAAWRGHPLSVLVSSTDDQRNRVPELHGPPLASFTEDRFLVSSSFALENSNTLPEEVSIHVYTPFKLESLESYSSRIVDSSGAGGSSDRAKKFFALQILSTLEANPRETCPAAYVMARRISDSGLFSYKLMCLSSQLPPTTGSPSLYDLLRSHLPEFQLSTDSPSSVVLGEKRVVIERQLFAEGSSLHLQKAEALTKLVSKSSPTLSVVEEYQLKYLLSNQEELLDSNNSKDNQITYIYNV